MRKNHIYLLIVFTALFFAVSSFASTLRTNKDQLFTGSNAKTNYIINSGAEDCPSENLSTCNYGITTPIGFNMISISTNPLIGDKSFLLTSSSDNEYCFRGLPLPVGLEAANMVASLKFASYRVGITDPPTGMEVYVRNRTDDEIVSNSVTLWDAENPSDISINFVGRAGKAYDVCAKSSTSSRAIIDDVFLGEWDGVGKGQEVEVVLRARRGSSDQNISTINPTTVIYNTKQIDPYGGLNTSTGVFTVPKSGTYIVQASAALGSATFNTSGQYLRTMLNGSTLPEGTCEAYRSTSSTIGNVGVVPCPVKANAGDQISIVSISDADSSYSILSAASTSFLITYISPENTYTRINARGSEWTSYTPTITYTSGGMTNVTHDFKYKCIDSKTLAVEGITAFNGTSGTYSSPKYSLPSGASSPSGMIFSVWGGYMVSGGTSAYATGSTAANADGTISPAFNSVNSNLTSNAGINNVRAGESGDVISFGHFNIPIEAGFCPNPVAPRVAQGQISMTNQGGTDGTVRAGFTCSSSSSVAFGGITVGNVSSGACAISGLPFTSDEYSCSFVRDDNSTSGIVEGKMFNRTPSGFTFTQHSESGPTAAADWMMLCSGPIN